MSEAGIIQRLMAGREPATPRELGACRVPLREHVEGRGARAINPACSLARERAIPPHGDPAVLDRMADGLRKAGIDAGDGAG